MGEVSADKWEWLEVVKLEILKVELKEFGLEMLTDNWMA